MNTDYKDRNHKKWMGLKYAVQGVKHVFQTEKNFKTHFSMSIIVIILGFFLRVSLVEWAVLFTIMALVISLEMINSSIERIMDYLSPEWHSIVGDIKDIAAGAVLLAAVSSIIIGCLIFLPKLIALF
ncbi:diacylglycerol kinase [Halobacillus seohaensis]|uniref:Diacylglycerol kinase n=1 Tax=Halobacillus seohaensis TaxID=447421 RepID=A0ABW2EI62_9BACI